MQKLKSIKLLGVFFLGITLTALIVTTSNCSCSSKNNNEQIIPIESIKLDKSNLTLEVGESEQLKAIINPKNAIDQKVTWSSSNESVATVNEEGIVIAISAGTVTIIAATNNKKTARCGVAIVDFAIPVESITIDKTNLTLEVGKSKQLKAIINPKNATNKKVTWFSSDESVAVVGEDGIVTAVKVGSVEIIVTSCNNKTTKCNIFVVEKEIPVVGIELYPLYYEMPVGTTKELTIAIEPSNATNKNVNWSIDGPEEIVSIDNGVVKALKAGKVNVRVETEDGKYSAICAIKVYDVIFNNN